MCFEEDLKRFKGLGRITAYHFMTDIGLEVIKPDRVLVRIFTRMGLLKDTDDSFCAIEIGRQFSKATNLPIRYIDIIFVLYGQLNVPKIKCICSEKHPHCEICGARMFCAYFNNMGDDGEHKITNPPVSYTMDELNEAQTAIISTLHKCEKIQIGKKLGASQQTLLDRRIRALRLALALITNEISKV